MTHAIKEPEKAALSRAEFLERIRVKPTSVTIPGIGEIQIRGLTAPEVQKIKSGSSATPGANPSDDMFAILTVVTGMISPALSQEDIVALKKEGKFATVHKISGEIMKLSGVGEEAKND